MLSLIHILQLSAEEKDALVQSEMLLQDSGLEVADNGFCGTGAAGGGCQPEKAPEGDRQAGGCDHFAGLS